MRTPEEELLRILIKNGVDFTCSLPCEKIKTLLEMITEAYGNAPLRHVPLTREEEGVGLCAGAALAGGRPAMFVQSSGFGNMINALLSLTQFYQLPLALFISWRGIHKEKIAAQIPMGKRLEGLLRGSAIQYTSIMTRGDFRHVESHLAEVYKGNIIHAFPLSPALWEMECEIGVSLSSECPAAPSFAKTGKVEPAGRGKRPPPGLTRFEYIAALAPFIEGTVVVSNLGFPSKELYHIKHQPSNFYMLGSMGMATPIGLGIALTSEKQVLVIDGDGSLLMNPGSLATAACLSPPNLTILAIDNGSYGSTGNQPTLTGSCVDLEAVARGFGIKDTYKIADPDELIDIVKAPRSGMIFIHALAVPGNRDLPNIPLDRLDIKKQVQEFLRKDE